MSFARRLFPSAIRFVFVLAAAFAAGPASAATAALAVEGRVTASGRTPIPEAIVQLLPLVSPVDEARAAFAGTPPAAAARALTDGAGRFRIVAPRAGLWTVRVEAPGSVPREVALRPLLESLDLGDVELLRDTGLNVRVAAADGRPLAGALVGVAPAPRRGGALALREQRDAVRVARTGPDGSVRVPRADGEALEVRAVVPGTGWALRETTRGGALALALPAAGVRTIVLTRANGTPAAGAVLFAGPRRVAIATTGDDGRAAVAVPAGGLELEAEDSTGATATITVSSTGEGAVAARLAAPRALAGRVVDRETRRPIAGALAWDDRQPWRAAASGARGEFTLQLAARGRVRLNAAAGGSVPADALDVAADDGAARGTAIALAPASAIEGTVRDAKGRPVAGATVGVKEHAEPTPGEMHIVIRRGEDAPGPAARSDERGHYRVAPLAPGAWDVDVTAPGFARRALVVRDLEPYRTKGGVDVELVAGAAVTGRIVDGASRPIAGATIELKAAPAARGEGRTMMFGGDDDAHDPPTVTATDHDGRFRLPGLAAGRYDVFVTRSGFARRTIGGVDVAETGTDLADVSLAPGVRLEGWVRNPAGEPVEGAQVLLASAARGGAMALPGMLDAGQPPDAVTGPDGWFAIDGLARGEHAELTVRRTGYVRQAVPSLEVPPAEPLAVVLRPASIVAGTVTDADGKPVAAADVSMAVTKKMGTGQMSFAFRSIEGATADALGRFRYEGVEPGRVSLTARAPGLQEARLEAVEVPEGQDVTDLALALKPGAWLVGQVLAPDGRSAIGARVGRVKDGEMGRFDPSAAETDADGWYRVDGLAPGELSIEATHSDYPRVAKDVTLRAGENRLDLAFSGGVRVSGRVVDPGGAPLAGATVSLRDPGAFWGGGSETVSGADGSFTIGGVREGTYDVWAARDGYGSSRGTPRVEVKGPVDGVVVRLARAGRIAGRVTGLEPADFARVQIGTDRSGAPAFNAAPVDHTGRFVLDGVEPGTYTVRGQVADTGRQARSEATLAAGQDEAQVTLEFGRGLALSGTARQARRPVTGAMVRVEGKDVRASGWARTDANGAFRIDGLEPGRYALALRQWDTGLAYDQDDVDIATSREITLDVPAAELAGSVVDAADGAPLAGVTLSLAPAGADAPDMFQAHGATSDVNGRFTIGSLADGTFTLRARREGYAQSESSVTIAGGRVQGSVRVALDATEGLTLRVSLPGGGVPDEVLVAVLDAAGRVSGSSYYATGENGRVRLATLAAGAWELLVSAPGTGTAALRVQAPGPAVAVTLPRATTLRVVVPALAGDGTIGTVTVKDASGRPFRTLSMFGRTSAEWPVARGEATVDALPPGTWTVDVAAADGRRWSATQATAPEAVATLTLK